MFRLFAFLALFIFSNNLFAKNYIIFSVENPLPTGKEKKERTQKNFFINIGKIQGISKGSKLEVVRKSIRTNSMENNKEYTNYIPIGKIKVIHSDDYSSIAVTDEIYTTGANSPLAEPSSFMIGDFVKVQ